MALLWTSISILLGIELFILLLLCLPLPWGVRKNISRLLYRIKARDFLDATFKYVMFAIFIALSESLNSLRKLYFPGDSKGEKDGSSSPTSELNNLQEFRWKKARAERNLYLATFAITAMMAIARLVRLAAIEVQLRNKIKEYNGNRPLTETGEVIDEKKE